MNLDSAALKVVLAHMATALTGAYLQKVSQLTRFDLLWQFRQPGETHKVLTLLHPQEARLFYASTDLPTAQVPTAFVMLLRKHLQGKPLLSLSQDGLERSFEFHFANHTLLFEMPGGRNNVYLLDGQDKILGVLLRDLDNPRHNLPGSSYSRLPQPPKPDASRISREQILEQLTGAEPGPAQKVLVQSFFGIPPLHASYICAQAQIDPQQPLAAEQLPAVSTAVVEWVQRLQHGPFEFCTLDDGYLLPWPIPSQNATVHSSLQQALQYQVSQPGFADIHRELLKKVNKYRQKTAIALQKRLEQLDNSKRADLCKLKGELILAYMWQITAGSESVELPDYEGQNLEIKLDPLLTASDNAQKYFREYKRLQRARESLKEPIAKAREQLEFADEVLVSLENAALVEELEEIASLWEDSALTGHPKPKPASKPQVALGPRQYVHRGFTILVGRNPRQNDYISTKVAAPRDLWFHSRGVPGSHVLLRCAGRVPEQETILAAATLAAKHCHASKSGSVPVSYTEARNVGKPKGSLPGRVVIKAESTIVVSPQVEIAELTEIVKERR